MRPYLVTEPFTMVDHAGRPFSYGVGQSLMLAPEAAAALGNNVLDPTTLPPVDWWGAPRRILAEEFCETQPVPFLEAPTHGALRILQGVGFDPGCAAYRFHTALNETTPHASMFFRWKDSSPYTSMRQFDGERDLALLRAAVLEADVVHCHMNYLAITNSRVRPKGRIIRHYHGSLPTGESLVEQSLDDAWGAVQVGARLSHLEQSPRMHWLPIAVPVDRYKAMADKAELTRRPRRSRGVFRVAHSPTNRGYKGTDALLDVTRRMRNNGAGIEVMLIEGMRHGAALLAKATCDVVFDSFWLGIQGSGLEGGAMAMPVIAGDSHVAELYREHVGHVPYTFADDAETLERKLFALMDEPNYYAAEAARVHAYVRTYHDYAAVAKRYDAILEAEL